MTWRLVVALALWVTSSAASFGAPGEEVVRQIRIAGTRRVAEDVVRGWIVAREGRPVNDALLAADARRILEGYRDRGFWHVTLLAPRLRPVPGGVDLVFDVSESEPTRIASVRFTGNATIDALQLADATASRAGDVLVASTLSLDAQRLLDLYEQNGHPYAAIRPSAEVKPGVFASDVDFAVDEGPRVVIGDVRVLGRGHVRDDVLIREVGIHIGDVYDQRAVDRAVGALRRLPYVRNVSEPRLERDARSGQDVLVFDVEEARTTRAEGLVGLAPATGGGHVLTGTVGFSTENLLGTGRQAAVRWERLGEAASDLTLSYREPWIFGLPFAASARIAMTERADFADSGIEGRVGVRTGPGGLVEATLGAASIRPRGFAPGITRSHLYQAGVAASVDTRDDVQAPRRGRTLRAVWRGSRVVRVGIPPGRRFRAETDVVQYLPFRRRSVLRAHAHGAGVWESGGVAPEALLRLGGSSSVRGYPEEYLLALRGVWGGLEWRRLVGPGSDIFTFLDIGAARVPVGGGGSAWRRLLGYGVGVRAPSRAGIVGISYALAYGADPGEGMIHLQVSGSY